MPKTNSLQRISTLTMLLILAVIFASTNSFAKNKCSEITDLDDKADCYAKEIEEKEEEYESTSKRLEDIRGKKNNIDTAISGYLNELNVTQAQIDELQEQITQIKGELDTIKELLSDRRGQLAKKVNLRNLAIRNYLKKNYRNDLEMFFSLEGFQYSSLTYVYNKSVSEDSLKLIKLLNSEIDTYEGDKKEAESIKLDLEQTQKELLSLKSDIDNKKLAAQKESSTLAEQQDDVEEDLEEIQREIADLSSKQKEILNAKSGGDSGSVGDYEPPEASTPKAPFSPAFAAFSYGAYTHYNGMSQYGAKGRADDGQDYKEIIKHYYKTNVKEKDDFPSKISVQGYGELDFDYYLYGIAEMPSSWPMDALKAQAIAARTYAYRAGKPICTTQSCQVFLKSKADNPPSAWKKAVDETEDMILEDSNVSSQYSSTTGGYLNQSGWDVDGDWPNDAYEKKAESPWFRKAWYTKSYNDSSNCGRAHPWLNSEELADIVNAYVVYDKGSDSEADHISPVTTNCWGGDPYSLDEMREKAEKYGGGHESASNVSVTIGNNGQTTNVKVTTNKGTISMDGQTFKTVYNLRAPSYLSIKSRLFDFEKD